MKVFGVTVGVAAVSAGLLVVQYDLPGGANDQSPGAEQQGFAIGEPAPVVPPLAERTTPEPSLEFDLLRVEPDGSMVIAGRAAPNTTVEILAEVAPTLNSAGNAMVEVTEGTADVAKRRTLGTATTGRSGAFVYTHAGEPSRLTIRLREGKRLSRQVAVVEPSASDREPLALVTSPSEATRIVQAPEAAGSALPVSVMAVEVEGEKVFVAGKARRTGNVRVYVDEVFIGETIAGPDDRFLLESRHVMPAGRHQVRVDVVDGPEAEVKARAEVPLIHRAEPPTTALARAGEGKPRDMPAADGDLLDDPAALRTGASIIIRRGDSLWRISRRAYGRGMRFTTIFEANRDQIRNPNRIYAGQVFKLPPRDEALPGDG